MRNKTTKKKRLIKAEDLLHLNIITEVAISPDEKNVAYIQETVSDDKKKYFSRIFIIDCNTGELRQYTFGDVSDRNPVWSPNGDFIAFISTRDKKNSIYIIPVGGGAEKKIIEKDGTFSELVWMPDGKSLIYVFRYNDTHLEKDEKKKKEPPLYRHISRVFYRLNGFGFLPRDRNHIWKLDINTGQARQLTKGKYDDFNPCVSPDGRRIAFVSNHSRNPDVDYLRYEFFVIPSDGGQTRKIKTPAGPIGGPVYSPDGKKIAYIGHADPDASWGVENLHVWTVGTSGRPAAKDLISKFDRMVADTTLGDTVEGAAIPPLFWSADGKRVYFAASDIGCTHLFYVPAKGGLPTRITHTKCHIKSFSLNGKRKKIAAIYSDLKIPGELHIIPPVYGGDGKTEKLIRPDRKRFSEIILPKIKEVWFRAFDGTELQGWLVTPPKFNRNRKYPAILEIHGGPRMQYGFSYYHEMLWLASKGYVIFYTNPRGGTGRGKTFADAIAGGWGEIDYADCMAAADYLEKLPFVDRNRMGVTGGSYGGYMTNWIIGHTNRFKAAVTQRSVVNLVSFYGSSDIGYTFYRSLLDHPWENREKYEKYSPLTYAKKIKTPLLIIHSENDLRCSIEQAEQLFITLKLMRKKVEFVRFPEEQHGLCRHGRPDRRLARLEWILKWFDRNLK